MATRHRPTPATARRHATRAAALSLAVLLSACACPGGSSDPSTTSPEPEGPATGIPDTWAAAIDDGKDRRPDNGGALDDPRRMTAPAVYASRPSPAQSLRSARATTRTRTRGGQTWPS